MDSHTYERAVVWGICALTVVAIVVRPRRTREWLWAVSGAAVLVATGLMPVVAAGRAVAGGSDVYMFLAGMMMVAESARRQGLFDWAASRAVGAASGSSPRLFALLYGVGVAVTVTMSNDATAVVLTPAVIAAVRRAGVTPLPYLLACAFVANAASFVLPISNPANLVVFGTAIPPLGEWLRFFALPSVLAIAITFAAVFLLFRRGMQSAVAPLHDRRRLGVKGWIVLCGAAATVLVLMTASVFHWPLGRCTLACALVIVAVVSPFDRGAFAACVKHVSWSTLAFVAGLFVLVAALDSTGVLSAVRGALLSLRAWPAPAALMVAGAAITVVANVANNLPAGVLAGAATAALPAHDVLRQGVAIAIDLAPNLSVTGSLATLLWLNALRREGIEMDAWTFLRVGAVVMPAALVPALLSLLLTNR